MTRYFIRYGESTANANKIIAGRLDVALDAEGCQSSACCKQEYNGTTARNRHYNHITS
jgi:broad specificity phosphatase PhoE